VAWRIEAVATDTQSGGALGWLDRVSATFVNLSGAAATVKANLAAAKTSDKTPVAANSPVQFSNALGLPVVWIIGGVLVLGAGAFLLSRR
jgi:hypothetical protein